MNNMSSNDLGDLRAARERVNRSQVDVASLCKVTEKAVRKWESGGGMNFEHAVPAMSAYGVRNMEEFWKIYQNTRAQALT